MAHIILVQISSVSPVWEHVSPGGKKIDEDVWPSCLTKRQKQAITAFGMGNYFFLFFFLCSTIFWSSFVPRCHLLNMSSSCTLGQTYSLPRFLNGCAHMMGTDCRRGTIGGSVRGGCRSHGFHDSHGDTT